MGHVLAYPFWAHYFYNDSSQAAEPHWRDRSRETPNCAARLGFDEWIVIKINSLRSLTFIPDLLARKYKSIHTIHRRVHFCRLDGRFIWVICGNRTELAKIINILSSFSRDYTLNIYMLNESINITLFNPTNA